MNRGLLIAASVAAALSLTAWGAWRAYFVPAGRLRTQLAADRETIRTLEAALGERSRTATDLRAIASSGLGRTEEEVDAALRDRLNMMASAQGLTRVQVETREPKGEASPAGGAGVRGEIGRRLRRGSDFWIVRGSLAGHGTLDQVLRTLAAIQGQPWVHRVESFAIKPVGKEREQFELRVGVATVMMPDLLPASFAPPGVVVLDEGTGRALGRIASKNVFREAPPGAPAQAGAAAPSPRSPYADWKLTGIVEVGVSAEAWLHNTRSNERVTLTPGRSVLDAKLIGAAGEQAVFEIRGERFEVSNGQTLEERRPAGVRAEAGGQR